jgi:hypothetical protein
MGGSCSRRKPWFRAARWFCASLLILAGSFAGDGRAVCVGPGPGFPYRIPQPGGEAPVSRLAITAPTEDAWLLVMDRWFDVGYQERARSVVVDD